MSRLAGMVLIELSPRSNPAGENNRTWESLAERARFNPQQLSALAGVSLRTLQRHFARHYQLTVGKFLYQLRMREALKRLDSGQSVKAISFDLGFKQVSHFSRVFKGFYGAPQAVGSVVRLKEWSSVTKIDPCLFMLALDSVGKDTLEIGKIPPNTGLCNS